MMGTPEDDAAVQLQSLADKLGAAISMAEQDPKATTLSALRQTLYECTDHEREDQLSTTQHLWGGHPKLVAARRDWRDATTRTERVLAEWDGGN
jgi:hypothetical protein